MYKNNQRTRNDQEGNSGSYGNGDYGSYGRRRNNGGGHQNRNWNRNQEYQDYGNTRNYKSCNSQRFPYGRNQRETSLDSYRNESQGSSNFVSQYGGYQCRSPSSRSPSRNQYPESAYRTDYYHNNTYRSQSPWTGYRDNRRQSSRSPSPDYSRRLYQGSSYHRSHSPTYDFYKRNRSPSPYRHRDQRSFDRSYSPPPRYNNQDMDRCSQRSYEYDGFRNGSPDRDDRRRSPSPRYSSPPRIHYNAPKSTENRRDETIVPTWDRFLNDPNPEKLYLGEPVPSGFRDDGVNKLVEAIHSKKFQDEWKEQLEENETLKARRLQMRFQSGNMPKLSARPIEEPTEDWVAYSPPSTPPPPTTSSSTSKHSGYHSHLPRRIVSKDYVARRLRNPCLFCSGAHKADQCHVIVDAEKRMEFLMRNERCTRCFKRHFASECRQIEGWMCYYCFDEDTRLGFHHSAICLEAYPEFDSDEKTDDL